MVHTFTKVPGDNFFPDFNRVIQIPAKVDNIVKGAIYTVDHDDDNDNEDFGLTDTLRVSHRTFKYQSVDDNQRRIDNQYTEITYLNAYDGAFQALEDGKAGDMIHCLGPGSRIGVRVTGAPVFTGDRVAYAYGGRTRSGGVNTIADIESYTDVGVAPFSHDLYAIPVNPVNTGGNLDALDQGMTDVSLIQSCSLGRVYDVYTPPMSDAGLAQFGYTKTKADIAVQADDDTNTQYKPADIVIVGLGWQ